MVRRGLFAFVRGEIAQGSGWSYSSIAFWLMWFSTALVL